MWTRSTGPQGSPGSRYDGGRLRHFENPMKSYSAVCTAQIFSILPASSKLSYVRGYTCAHEMLLLPENKHPQNKSEDDNAPPGPQMLKRRSKAFINTC